MRTTTQFRTVTEREMIVSAFAAKGEDARAMDGGYLVNGRGYISLSDARAESGINQMREVG